MSLAYYTLALNQPISSHCSQTPEIEKFYVLFVKSIIAPAYKNYSQINSFFVLVIIVQKE